MSASQRISVHAWVLRKAQAIENSDDIVKLYNFCDVVQIDEGHDEIIATIDHTVEELLGIKDYTGMLKQVIRDQKAEAEARKAEQAKLATADDKFNMLWKCLRNAIIKLSESNHLLAEKFHVLHLVAGMINDTRYKEGLARVEKLAATMF